LIWGGLIAALLAGIPHESFSEAPRPQVGEVTSLPDAMLIYLARRGASACGENCSDWLVAEGTIHWDGYKRVIAALDRFAGPKVMVVLNVRGRSDLRASLSVGKVLRERGVDTTVGQRLVDQCRNISETDCIALKPAGGPLPASRSGVEICDIACILVLAGGVRRSIPETTVVIIQGTQVGRRLGLDVPEEIRDGVHARSNVQVKLYLTQMGVDPALA
jgi:hypothetical protein